MVKKPRRKRKPNRGVSRIPPIDTPHSYNPSTPSIQSRMRVVAQSYSGPVMPPEMIRDWENICPGSADRFLKLHENQAEHRQSLERSVIISNIDNEKRGQNYAFILFAIALLGGFVLTALGIQVVGVVSIIGSMATIVSLFIYQKVQGKNDLKEKRQKIESPSMSDPETPADKQLNE